MDGEAGGYGGRGEDEVCWSVDRTEQTQCRIQLVKLVFPNSIRKVVLLIFKQLVFLNKMFTKNFNQPNMDNKKTYNEFTLIC